MTDLTLLDHAAGLLLDVGVQSTVVLGSAWLVSRGFRRLSASARHAVFAVLLLAMPVLAVRAASLPHAPVSTAHWVVGGWLVGMVVALLPVLVGLLRLALLTARADGGGPVRTTDVPGPLTWGLWRPVILLPRTARWSPGERALILAHERAHIARSDWALHVLGRLICAVFWFQPLAWWAWKRMGDSAESAADDRVLHQGAKASTYASVLLRMSTHAGLPALSMAAHPVKTRVLDVLHPGPRSLTRAPGVVLSATVLTVWMGVLGTWTPWTIPPGCAPDPSADQPPPLLRGVP